ncbi:MAG: hypothetical protein GXP16_01465 [Gammaproteobacteria bacterium]|nr:hypothetical protein [Gammaproteobacteria bacterium]
MSEIMETGALLITGCPRSGTKSAWKFYQERNVFLGHECPGEMGTIEWRNAYQNFNMEDEDRKWAIVNVLVRDPLSTVASLAELLRSSTTSPNIHKHTHRDIQKVALDGGWLGLLDDHNHVDAAIEWWTTVYEGLLGLPTLRIEDWPNLPHEHQDTHSRKWLTARDTGDSMAQDHHFWTIAKMYGYYRD